MNNMRLIDADALGLDINRKAHENFPANRNLTLYAESLLAHAHTIDAVPVVRCKDCRKSGYDAFTGLYWCAGNGMRGEDFCSRGERKDGE